MTTPQVILSKTDLDFIQQRGFLKSSSDVDEVWKLITSRCPPYVANSNQSNPFSFIKVPSLIGGLKSKDTSSLNDAVVSYSSKSGATQAKLIQKTLKEKGLKVNLAYEENSFTLESCESKVANSTALIVILTADALKQLEVVYSMTAAQYYYKSVSQVILVHDAGSCLFPGYDEQPPALANLFSEKAVTFLSCYAEIGISEVENKVRKEISHQNKANDENQSQAFQHLLSLYESTDKISVANIQDYLKLSAEEIQNLMKDLDQNQDGFVTMEEFSRMFSKSEKFASLFSKQEEHAPEDLTTRIFLSHKRSSGQAIVGRLYECLKDHYSIFLDSEAKFQIHNLKQIVESTSHFVFVLSAGIFLSKWCLEELKSAVANKKPVTVVRDLAYNLPPVLPPEWADYDHLFRKPDQLIWVAEYNKACVDALIKKIGPSDVQLAGASILCSPRRVEQVKNSGVLKIPGHLSNCLGATCMKLKELGVIESVRTLDCRNYGFTTEDMMLLQDHNIKFPNLEILQIQEHRNIQGLFQWLSDSNCNLRVLECGFHGVHVTDADLETIGAKFARNLTEISLNHTDCSKQALLAFFAKVPNLHKLALRFPEAKLDSELVEGLATLCPRLESLEIHHPEVVGRPFQNAKFPFLKNFYCQGIDSWEGSVDVAFEDLAQACPGLRAVYFDCWNPEMETVTPAGLQALGSGCPHIESLVCLGDDSVVKILPQFFPNLKILDVRTGPTDEGLKMIGELSHLEEISIIGDSITGAGLQHVHSVLPKLKKLKLLEFVKATEEEISRVLRQATSLEALVVTSCRVTPATVLANVTKTLTYLEFITVGANEFKLTLKDLQTLQNFPNLKKVLGTVAGITDHNIAQLTPLLCHLEELCVGPLQEITPKGINQLVAGKITARYVELRSMKFKEFGVTLSPGMAATVLSRKVNLEYQKKNPDCDMVMLLTNN